MSGQHDIWLGDLLRCLDRLRALDDAHAATVARLLGLTWASPPRQVAEPDESNASESADAGVEDGDLDLELDDAPLDSVPAESDALPKRQRLEPVGHVNREAVRPWEGVEALQPYIPEVHGTALPHEPLWEPRWTRELLAAALATQVPGYAIDERRAVETISRAQPLTEVPRVPGRTLGRGVQVLVDVGEAMAPYARDRTHMVEAIRLVVGRRATEVLRFSAAPRRGAGRSGRSTWRQYAPPEAGTPVVALTDLGIGGPPTDPRRARPEEWQDLAVRLKRRRSRVIALVPYAPARWPADLARAITILRWDRPATVADILERVLQSERR